MRSKISHNLGTQSAKLAQHPRAAIRSAYVVLARQGIELDTIAWAEGYLDTRDELAGVIDASTGRVFQAVRS